MGRDKTLSSGTAPPDTLHTAGSSQDVSVLGIKPSNGMDSGGDDTQHSKRGYLESIHGDTAARRRAITELLFFASVGDVRRCQRIVRIWNLPVADPTCCDYDKRTPMHLAASEGAYQVSEWLLSQGVDINSLDRFKRTPLEDAVRGEFREVAKLLSDNGGKVFEEGSLVDLKDSKLAGMFGHVPQQMFDFDPEWEIDPDSLEIMEKLGEGEFGVVHRAKWYGTLVAAKILKGSNDIALGDFRGEIEILRRVHHPNAVQFLGACTKKEPFILVTELMSGGSLADAFRRPQVFPIRRAVEIAVDAARGLAYLHHRHAAAGLVLCFGATLAYETGFCQRRTCLAQRHAGRELVRACRKPNPIIHRDLKPGNLLLSGGQYQDQLQIVFDTGMVKLADFGLSKTLPINKHAEFGYLDSKFRLTGETGSYRYMAPEVFRHEPYNSRVDVYSFSMIVYQLFEFQPPFAGMDPVEAARQAALYERRPEFVALMQPHPMKKEVRELIARCWSPNPEDRPAFATLVKELEAILTRLPRTVMLRQAADGAKVESGCFAARLRSRIPRAPPLTAAFGCLSPWAAVPLPPRGVDAAAAALLLMPLMMLLMILPCSAPVVTTVQTGVLGESPTERELHCRCSAPAAIMGRDKTLSSGTAPPDTLHTAGSSHDVLAWPWAATGEELKQRVQDVKVLAVGAGGIGCELLKTLVMSGFKHIEVVDLDTIETSNLNRQFLFRKRHVGKSKALVVAEAGNVKESRFDVDFFRRFDCVLNGLDNLEARRHINRLCLAAEVPLVESGTAGYLGQVSVHIKGRTECFECQPKPTPKTFPVCTLRNTPDKPIHCVVWAKEMLFPLLFGAPEASDLHEAPPAGSGDNAEAGTRKTLDDPSFYQRCQGESSTHFAERQLYCTKINELRDMEDLWRSRRPPQALELHALRMPAYADAANQPAAREAAVTATASSACKELGLLDAHTVWNEQQNAAVFLRAVELFLDGRSHELGSAQFDKDDTLAVEFVTAAANLRATCFGISRQSLFDTKGMAGNIIHAVATTNAIVSGLIVIEALKLLAGSFASCQTSFLQVSGSKRLMSRMSAPKPNAACMVCSTAQASLVLNTDKMSLQQLVDKVTQARRAPGHGQLPSTEYGVFVEPVVTSLPNARIASCIEPLQQVLKGRLALMAPSLWCGTFNYEEGEGLEEDEITRNRKLLLLPLAQLPGGGVVHNSILHVDDQEQCFKAQLIITHREDWDNEQHPEGFFLGGDLPTALAEPSVEAAISEPASADKDVVSLSSGDDEVATEAAARPGGGFHSLQRSRKTSHT
ncbi:SUMO-activating enzyme subunit 2 [Chlorella vulgaris]